MSVTKHHHQKTVVRAGETGSEDFVTRPLRIVRLPGNHPSQVASQQQVIVGLEIEAYSIQLPDYTIGRRHSRPRPGLSEEGERFTRDTSIGSEYNSRPFSTIREASFLLKTGLRKYLRGLYRGQDEDDEQLVPLLVGGWTNRFAGTHLHVSLADETMSIGWATSLARHIHDHLPLLIAVGANSPIWNKRVTAKASNRLIRGSDAYFAPLKRGELSDEDLKELRYTTGRRTKPPTLEIRALDSNLPEFVVAAVCIVKAISLRWLSGRGTTNRVNDVDYMKARHDAGLRGMKSRLSWKGEWISARKYLDKFLWEYRDELDMMDLPEECYDTFRLLKRGFNGARIIHDAAHFARKEHPQTWQRRFAKRYSTGLELLLSGNTLRDFAATLGVQLPDTDETWLGRRTATIDG
jgi:hypothetical protein